MPKSKAGSGSSTPSTHFSGGCFDRGSRPVNRHLLTRGGLYLILIPLGASNALPVGLCRLGMGGPLAGPAPERIRRNTIMSTKKNQVTPQKVKLSHEEVTLQAVNLSHDEIALRAYCLWQERGSPIGSPEEDWLRAEQEIRGRASQSPSAGKRVENLAHAASAS